MEKFHWLIIYIAILLFVASCSHGRAKPPGKYNSLRISGKVLHAPGAVAWSPSGASIAYLRNGLNIYDIESGKITPVKVGLNGPFFLRWISEAELLVLFRESERNILGIVNMRLSMLHKTELDDGVEAVFEDSRGNGLLIYYSTAEKTRIGTDVSYVLSAYDIKRKETKKIYSTSKILYGRNYGAHRFSGWIIAAPSPLDPFTVLLMEYVKPPVFPPYLKVKHIDCSTSVELMTMRIEGDLIYPLGSWSPDGMRIALADRSDRLRILNYRGGLTAVDDKIAGRYPSWNPEGSQIFFGGHLLESNGTTAEPIAPDKPESIAFWSPDGTRMALLLDEDLWMLEGFHPKLLPPDVPLDNELKTKISILRELLDEELITKSEFIERYIMLINKDDH
jgi:hypothetical protein